MDEKIEVNDKTVIDLAKIIHKHNQYIQADWEEYTKSDLALAYAIKWNGYRKESDTAREIYKELFEKQTEVYNKYVFKKDNDYDDLETNAIINFSDSLSYEFEKYFKEKYGVDLGE